MQSEDIEIQNSESVNADQIDIGEETDVRNPGTSIGPKKRKRYSQVWEHFTIVIENNVKKGVCIYCHSPFKLNEVGTTSALNRHVKSCFQRQLKDKKQSHLVLHDQGQSQGGNNMANISVYRYDKEAIRKLLAQMIIVHEYSFRMVEHTLFNRFCQALNPKFEKISRHTIRSDCMKVFQAEKKKLAIDFKEMSKICLTTDLWTSSQTIGYMCLTAHFMDSDWNLHKRILNFFALPPPHTGIVIGDAITKCLMEWEIREKICTITMDNASTNTAAVKNLKDCGLKGMLYFGGKIFHVRCCAHILNLMVQDGLAVIQDVIKNVRESVKYLKLSPSRLFRFSEIAKHLELPTSRKLILDVPTRWNSTFHMLESALVYKDAFPMYKLRDTSYAWLPSEEDWEKAKEVADFLSAFDDATRTFSGTKFPTSNLYLPCIWKIKQMLNERTWHEKDYVRDMVKKMNEKFDKYWKDCNLVLSIAVVLDPRRKMKFIEFVFPKMYPCETHTSVNTVRQALYDLYRLYDERLSSHSSGSTTIDMSRVLKSSVSRVEQADEEFDVWADVDDAMEQKKSDLDSYLEEGRLIHRDTSVKFDALQWWKSNTLKFRVLSQMARDILTIPISTVASESSFSAGGRILGKGRNALKPETLQALICAGDWIRAELGMESAPEEHDDYYDPEEEEEEISMVSSC